MADTGFNSTGKSVSGSTGAMPYVQYVIADAYGTAIGNGDPVSLSSGYLISCPESAKPVGVLRGIRYVDSTGEVRFANSYPASTTNAGNIEGFTDVVAMVEPVNDQIFFMQTSDAAFTQADVGTTKRIKTVGRSATTGASTAVVDMDASVTSELRLVRILGLFQRQGNAYGTGAIAEVQVV